MNDKVSVIVPCYNLAQYLSETLESVLLQTYSNWECIIVNDGSTDNTEEVAMIYCNKDNRFKYIYKENGGISSARNLGIKNSNGEFILPLDADDIIGKIYIEKAIIHFDRFPETKLFYCKGELFGELTGLWDLPDYNYERLLFENMIFCSAIYSISSYKQSGGYNEKMISGIEDWDFWLRLLDENDIVYQIPEICFFYRIRNNSRNRSIKDQAYLNKQMVISHIEKYERKLPDMVNIYVQIKQEMQTKHQEMIDYLETQLKQTRESNAFRLGKFVLKPISYLKNKLVK